MTSVLNTGRTTASPVVSTLVIRFDAEGPQPRIGAGHQVPVAVSPAARPIDRLVAYNGRTPA